VVVITEKAAGKPEPDKVRRVVVVNENSSATKKELSMSTNIKLALTLEG
jgi:hypothetical protein